MKKGINEEIQRRDTEIAVSFFTRHAYGAENFVSVTEN